MRRQRVNPKFDLHEFVDVAHAPENDDALPSVQGRLSRKIVAYKSATLRSTAVDHENPPDTSLVDSFGDQRVVFEALDRFDDAAIAASTTERRKNRIGDAYDVTVSVAQIRKDDRHQMTSRSMNSFTGIDSRRF